MTSGRSRSQRSIESGLGQSRCPSSVPTDQAGALRSGPMIVAGCPGRARWKAASLAVRLIHSSVGRSRRLGGRTGAGAVVSRRAARRAGSPTDTDPLLATAIRPSPVTDQAAGTGLRSNSGRDRITGQERTDTDRVAATASRAMDLMPGMGQAPVLAMATGRATGLVLARAAALVTRPMEDLARLAGMDVTTPTEAMAEGPAPMSTTRGTGTGREATTAKTPRTDRATATGPTLAATAQVRATRRPVRGGDHTLPAATVPAMGSPRAMAMDMAQAKGPIAATSRARRCGLAASATGQATASTRVTGARRMIRVVAADTARAKATDTVRVDHRDRQDRTEAATRGAAATAGVPTHSAMTSGRRTTTCETTNTRDQAATRRIQRMADTAKAGRTRPMATATSGRTGHIQDRAASAARSTRTVGDIRGSQIIAGPPKDSPATATARPDRGSPATFPTGRSTRRLGLGPPIGRLSSEPNPCRCRPADRPPHCRPALARLPPRQDQPMPRQVMPMTRRSPRWLKWSSSSRRLLPCQAPQGQLSRHRSKSCHRRHLRHCRAMSRI